MNGKPENNGPVLRFDLYLTDVEIASIASNTQTPGLAEFLKLMRLVEADELRRLPYAKTGLEWEMGRTARLGELLRVPEAARHHDRERS